MAQGTGNFKVTDTYLKDFANHQIQSFLDDAANNPAMTALMQYGTGIGGQMAPGPGAVAAGDFNKILDGNRAALPSAGGLQDGFKNTAASMRSQVQALTNTMGKTQRDLLMVGSYLKNAEDAAAITAEEMGQALGDVLGSNGSSANTSSATATPPPPTGH